jgi:hypothetical protein
MGWVLGNLFGGDKECLMVCGLFGGVGGVVMMTGSLGGF